MAKQTTGEFLDALDHPRKNEILRLCEIVRSADVEMTEQVKWNAPSFCKDGDDRVTLRINPPKVLQVIFHRGAKVKDASGFSFEDRTGRLKFAAADRAILEVKDAKDLEAMSDDVKWLVESWFEAT